MDGDVGSATVRADPGPAAFAAAPVAVRIFSGPDAFDALPRELRRLGIARPMVFCGRSVAERTPLPGRLRQLLGDDLAVFDGLQKEAPIDRIQAAAAAARGAQADGLLALGAGSVVKAVRIVAVLLAEDRPLDQLFTRYPAQGPAVSPRLDAPKLPIVNLLTAPTSAQCRAGSAARSAAHDHRLEFFDPKTRPRVIFWDAAALQTAPPALMRSTAASVYWRALMGMALLDHANPLVAGARRQAFRLASAAVGRIDDPADTGARIDLCAAALLQNRDEDDGGQPMQLHWAARMVYALSAGVFTLHPHIGQGEAVTSLTAAVLRAADAHDPRIGIGIAEALGLEAAGGPATARAVASRFAAWRWPTRLSALGLETADLPALRDFALKSFNADRYREFARDPDGVLRLLVDAL